ncbi:MAG: 30S ribosomal protein S20 [Spirochaetes bacterium]|nr:30S ribosomal protein S20 [Spirochaetota bacterium]MBN2771669.1 30S ribosomal protein S20 [Spirochaetota bacterium]HRX15627.1 30S ribosomal protein S20 [Spirochaetota bacterium]
MANNNSTKKRIRQAAKRNMRNSQNKSALRTASKKLLSLLDAKAEIKSDEVVALQNNFAKTVDKVAKNNVIHWKKAARLKSRMAKKVNSALA